MDAKQSYPIYSSGSNWSIAHLAKSIPATADDKQELRAGVGALMIYVKPLAEESLVKVASLRKLRRYSATQAVIEGVRRDLEGLAASVDAEAARTLADKLLAVVVPQDSAQAADGQAIRVGQVRVLAGLVTQMRDLMAKGSLLSAEDALEQVLVERAFTSAPTSSSPASDDKTVNFVPMPAAKSPAKPPG